MPPLSVGVERVVVAAFHSARRQKRSTDLCMYRVDLLEWNHVCTQERELSGHNFFAFYLPAWFIKDFSSPFCPRWDAKEDDIYVHQPEEHSPPVGIPMRPRAPFAPRPTIIHMEELLFDHKNELRIFNLNDLIVLD
jgi:hypothetical protein